MVDNHLYVTLAASTTYMITGIFYLSGNDTADFAFNFSFPANARLSGGMVSMLDSAAPGGSTAADANFRALTDELSPSTSLGMGIADTNYVMGVYRGLLRMSTTSGNLSLQWAQGASDATGTVLRIDSHLIAQRVF